MAHGLRAVAPVLPGEDVAQWEAYWAGVVADLRVRGTLETDLAERVASVSWRLRRIAAYEVAVASAPTPPSMSLPPGVIPQLDLYRASMPKPRTREDVAGELAAAGRELAGVQRLTGLLKQLGDGSLFARMDAMFFLRRAAAFLIGSHVNNCQNDAGVEDLSPDVNSDEFLAALGVPESRTGDADGWDGWTAEVVRAGVERLAESVKWTPERFLTVFTRQAADEAVRRAERCGVLRVEAATLELKSLEAELRSRQHRAMPAEYALKAVMRYEPHLARQLSDTLDMLERVQAARRRDD